MGISSAKVVMAGHMAGKNEGFWSRVWWRRSWFVAGAVVPVRVRAIVSRVEIREGAEVIGEVRREVRIGQKGTGADGSGYPSGEGEEGGEGDRLKRSRQVKEGEEGRR